MPGTKQTNATPSGDEAMKRRLARVDERWELAGVTNVYGYYTHHMNADVNKGSERGERAPDLAWPHDGRTYPQKGKRHRG